MILTSNLSRGGPPLSERDGMADTSTPPDVSAVNSDPLLAAVLLIGGEPSAATASDRHERRMSDASTVTEFFSAWSVSKEVLW